MDYIQHYMVHVRGTREKAYKEGNRYIFHQPLQI